MNSSHKAFILVGGKGRRLKGHVVDSPKPLAPIFGEPFLLLLLRNLKRQGVSNITLLTGHRAEEIKSVCSDGENLGLNINYSFEESPLGTGGALKNAESFLPADSETFLLFYGDTYIDCALTEIFKSQPNQEMPITVGVVPVENSMRYGSVTVNEQNQVVDFVEKGINKAGLVSAGVFHFHRSIFNSIPSNIFCSLEEDVLRSYLGKIQASVLNGPFYDIGTPESYNNFNSLIHDGKIKLEL